MPKLILVFWLLKFWALGCIVSFFDIVVIYDLTYILFLLFFITDFYCIDSNSQVGGMVLVFLLLLLLTFSGLIGWRRILKKSECIRNFRFVPTIVFYYSLSLNLIYGNVSRLTFLEIILIGLLYVKTWL